MSMYSHSLYLVEFRLNDSPFLEFLGLFLHTDVQHDRARKRNAHDKMGWARAKNGPLHGKLADLGAQRHSQVPFNEHYVNINKI